MRDKDTDGLMLAAMPDSFSDTCSATRTLGDLFNAVEKACNTRSKGQPKLVLTSEGRLSTVGSGDQDLVWEDGLGLVLIL